MLTVTQIQNFVGITKHELTGQMAKKVRNDNLNQCIDRDTKRQFSLTDLMINTVNGFDPDDDTECLTYDQVYSLMQTISKRLGFTDDLQNLPTA